MLKKRYLEAFIAEDINKKMAFIGGPRQVGKTTLAATIGEHRSAPTQYLTWDRRADREIIRQEKFAGDAGLIIFDELHKYRGWKNYLKGVYDTIHSRAAIIVTGSARLDLYRRGGDSLFGRYHFFRLHPFSVAELAQPLPRSIPVHGDLAISGAADSLPPFDDLWRWGGFPEPLLARDDRTHRRWQNERIDRLIKEDIRDVELVRDLSGLEILSAVLPAKVGSLLSINALRGDIGVAHKTAALWVDILERFYYHFRIYPWQTTLVKSLRKEPKLYLWDWSALADEGKKLENMVASHLLKLVHFLVDTQGYKADLRFLRDMEGREVDFVVTIDNQPWFAVEVKLADQAVAPVLNYFQERITIPYIYQVIKTPGVDFIQKSTRVISADKFLSWLV